MTRTRRLQRAVVATQDVMMVTLLHKTYASQVCVGMGVLFALLRRIAQFHRRAWRRVAKTERVVGPRHRIAVSQMLIVMMDIR